MKLFIIVYLIWLFIVFMYNPKNYIDDFKKVFNKIVYVCKHKKAYIMIMKKYKPYRITLRGLFHDSDKLMILIFMIVFCPSITSLESVSNFHKERSHHHQKAASDKDFYYQIIDYECARYTKLDKPMSAREYIEFKRVKGLISDIDYDKYIKIMNYMEL